MTSPSLSPGSAERVVVVGAGIGGLAAAALLAASGHSPLVIEQSERPGGKIRTLPTSAGPVDAGPTVLTLRTVFDSLFRDVGTRLDDHLDLVRQPVIARHFWPDGSQLDLHDDDAENIRAIRDFAGERSAREYLAFNDRSRRLFEAFYAPVMLAPRPDLMGLMAGMIGQPGLLRRMAPASRLSDLLRRSFSDPRLAQLFGRYATYVGGSPYLSPALMALIWRAESAGVWAIRGGMHQLAAALVRIAEARGARIRYGTGVARIKTASGRVVGVTLADGAGLQADNVIFNGDPRALAQGALGPGCESVAAQTRDDRRSLSADVWAFAAEASGVELAHHNVFFCRDPKAEFAALERGGRGHSPTLYVCAMDRGFDAPPPALERFEIIANAPPLSSGGETEGFVTCRDRTFGTLSAFGLEFSPRPGTQALTRPEDFDRMFPQSAGSLYGQSPHGLLAAFRRPTARTRVTGLYLAGGGIHPGPGLPMAALSGRHAAEAILTDLTSRSRFLQTGMRGGTSTGSARTATGPSASSRS